MDAPMSQPRKRRSRARKVCAWCGTALPLPSRSRARSRPRKFGMCERCLDQQLSRLDTSRSGLSLG